MTEQKIKKRDEQWQTLQKFCRYYPKKGNEYAAMLERAVIADIVDKEADCRTQAQFDNRLKDIFRNYPMAEYPNGLDPFEYATFDTPLSDEVVERFYKAYCKGGETGIKETQEIVEQCAKY